jgi:hypothetical protein
LGRAVVVTHTTLTKAATPVTESSTNKASYYPE